MRFTRERVCFILIILGLLADWSLPMRRVHADENADHQAPTSIIQGRAFLGVTQRFIF